MRKKESIARDEGRNNLKEEINCCWDQNQFWEHDLWRQYYVQGPTSSFESVEFAKISSRKDFGKELYKKRIGPQS